MRNEMDWEIIATIIGSLGGWDAIKYLLNRKQNARIKETEADINEFHVLKETLEFLQTQLREKEERFAEQTELVRKLNTEVLELTKKSGLLELDLQTYRCIKRKCGNREPQNGY